MAAASPTPSPTPKLLNPPQVQGIFDDEEDADATPSASPTPTPSPTPRPSATPQVRTTVTTTADTPVSGAVENTLALLVGGLSLISVGLHFSRSNR